MRDPRYVTVNGKPLFLVFRPTKLPNAGKFVGHWRRLAHEAGLKGLFLVAMDNKFTSKSLVQFDAVLHHGPGDYLNASPMRKIFTRGLRRALGGKLADSLPAGMVKIIRQPARYDFADVVKSSFKNLPLGDRYIPCVLAGWDNTPRSKHRGIVFENFTPELFRLFLKKAIIRVAQQPAETRLIFIKAWNEWAEGNYLEPDADIGSTLLDVIRDEMSAADDSGALCDILKDISVGAGHVS